MKRTIWVYGLISGLICISWMLVYLVSGKKFMNFDNGMYYGFGSMILAFSLMFVGVKNFRDHHNGGTITFGKAFKLAFLIVLVASTVYVVGWLLYNYLVYPEFMDDYTAHELAKLKAMNTPQADIDKYLTDSAKMTELYKNPIVKVAFTYMEILPLGTVMALICAFIFKKKA